MGKNRITYQDWIVQLGIDPSRLPKEIEFISLASPEAQKLSDEDQDDKAELIVEVGKALGSLSEDERELIVNYYYMGKTYLEISRLSGRTIHSLCRLRERALKKLKVELAGIVRQRFKVKLKKLRCCLCQSRNLSAINRIISERDKKRTWKPVIRELKSRFDIKIGSPQLLIGHEKYHMKKTDINS